MADDSDTSATAVLLCYDNVLRVLLRPSTVANAENEERINDQCSDSRYTINLQKKNETVDSTVSMFFITFQKSSRMQASV